LDESEDLWSVNGLQVELSSDILFSVVLEVSLVSDFLLLHLSHFLDFVVVDVEGLSVEGLLVQLLLGEGSIVWVLEANKGIDGFVLSRENLDALDFAVSAEVLLELLFGGLGREVLHVEIASLLGVLESHLVLLLFHVSLALLESFTNVEGVLLIDL
jgi:hypothetical protein